MKNLVFLFFVCSLVSCRTQTQNQVEYGSNPAAGKYIDVNDIKVYYEVYGDGEPLLLLHGNGGSIENFTWQIPELAKYFKVIAVDSRAQGRTSDSDQEISYALMASDMSGLIDKLNLGKVNVVGWSDGGNIGLELGYAHPEKVLKVVTIGANYSNENFLAPPDSVTMDSDDPRIIQTSPLSKKHRTTLERLSPNKERIPIIKKQLEALMEKYPKFTPDQIKTINVPFMVVAGDHDLISIDHTVSLFKNLPKAQLFIVPGASHLSPVENPDLINSQIIKFLKTPFRNINNYYFLK